MKGRALGAKAGSRAVDYTEGLASAARAGERFSGYDRQDFVLMDDGKQRADRGHRSFVITERALHPSEPSDQ